MTVEQSIDLVREALWLTLLVSVPILGASLVIGLVVSVLQAVTQIQEQTLSFVPKIVGMAVMTVIAAPWLFTKLLDFSQRMFSGLP